MTKRYVQGTEPNQPDQPAKQPQEQTNNTGVSGTTHKGRTSKETASNHIAAIRALINHRG